MIVVNFKIVFGGSTDNILLKNFVGFFSGKAAATFVVLAGVGIAFMSNFAVKTNNFEKIKFIKTKLVKRALLLFVFGLSYIWIWPADILHFYGVYILLLLPLFLRNSKTILISSLVIILFYLILIVIFNYGEGWNFSTLDYKDFWEPVGFLRNLFFNGFHPVIPWAAFMIFGFWFGKQNLSEQKFLRKSLIVSSMVFLLIQVLSNTSQFLFSNILAADEIKLLFCTEPMPPLPIYMFNGISIAVIVISASILVSEKYSNNFVINSLERTGKLALTFYFAHVVLGMGLLEELGTQKLGEYSLEFSFVYSILFSLLCIVFANIWLKYKKIGPIEWMFKKVAV